MAVKAARSSPKPSAKVQPEIGLNLLKNQCKTLMTVIRNRRLTTDLGETQRNDKKFFQPRQKPTKLDISKKVFDIPYKADSTLSWGKRLELQTQSPRSAHVAHSGS